MSYFIPLYIVAIAFYFLGRYDYKKYLRFQREVIKDTMDRESTLIDEVRELKSELITVKSMSGKI